MEEICAVARLWQRRICHIDGASATMPSSVLAMASPSKALTRILGGLSDANIRFDDLCSLLGALGFTTRSRGSHHIFSAVGIEELITLQRDADKAKPYQVRQVRRVIVRYNLRLKG